ncbi:MAG: alpha/beta hydrolase [Gammaproteobacteria bacterium]|jgi:hypothetical protein
MIKILSSFLAAVWFSSTAWAASHPAVNVEDYDYPIADSYEATVVGTPPQYQADLPKRIPVKEARLKVFKDREVPDFLWYEAELRYSYALQKKPAPLVFVIAGTGAAYNSAKNLLVGKAFYEAGFHVVALSSPTVPNFVVAASKTSVTGHATKDAEDLYHVMELIWDKLKKKAEVTNFFVTGYSLGGFNTAFVTLLDEERKVFDFKAALLINPPVSLYSSISLLDRMLENIPGGPDNFPQYYNDLVTKFSKVYKRADRLDFNEEFLYDVYQEFKPRDEELAALIGLSFRFSSAHLAFTSDVMTDFGYIKPKNVELTRNSSPGQYTKVAFRLGFTDYFHEFFYPYYKAQDPTLTRERLVEEMSLTHIEDYLRESDKIYVIHNANDVILEPGQIDFFPRVFGDRAKIYPTGGHCGNMGDRRVVGHMLSVFKSLVRQP